jgi:cellulose synthase/poly-beta-1,6-N-acetylglucosamine synthase-like glycosyltransferase
VIPVEAALFWLFIFLFLYPLVLYPGLICLLARLFPRPVKKGCSEPLPRVSVVIPAHNEEKVVAAKIENTLALDYPADRLEILMASDGSTDHTAEIARQTVHPSYRFLDFPVRRGKLSVLTDTVAQAKGELLVLTDTSAILAPDALLRAVENFADPRVGCVAGRYRIAREMTPELDARGESERGYFEFEILQRICESRFHSTLGAHGAFYMVRRSLFPEVPAGTINDDFVIPMLILAQGFLTVYEEKAVAFEIHLATVKSEFRRRVRISHGNFQQIALLLPLLLRAKDLRALFVFLSHKGIRAFQPFTLLGILVTSALLPGWTYRLFFLLQVLFYLLGLLSLVRPFSGRLLALPLYFLTGNAAIVLGFVRQLRQGSRPARLRWEKS